MIIQRFKSGEPGPPVLVEEPVRLQSFMYDAQTLKMGGVVLVEIA